MAKPGDRVAEVDCSIQGSKSRPNFEMGFWTFFILLIRKANGQFWVEVHLSTTSAYTFGFLLNKFRKDVDKKIRAKATSLPDGFVENSI